LEYVIEAADSLFHDTNCVNPGSSLPLNPAKWIGSASGDELQMNGPQSCWISAALVLAPTWPHLAPGYLGSDRTAVLRKNGHDHLVRPASAKEGGVRQQVTVEVSDYGCRAADLGPFVRCEFSIIPFGPRPKSLVPVVNRNAHDRRKGYLSLASSLGQMRSLDGCDHSIRITHDLENRFHSDEIILTGI